MYFFFPNSFSSCLYHYVDIHFVLTHDRLAIKHCNIYHYYSCDLNFSFYVLIYDFAAANLYASVIFSFQFSKYVERILLDLSLVDMIILISCFGCRPKKYSMENSLLLYFLCICKHEPVF